jgi:hypothetical protein
MSIPDLKEKLTLIMAERIGALVDDSCETYNDIVMWRVETESILYGEMHGYETKD